MSGWIEKEEVLKQIDRWFTTGEYKYSNATHYLNKRISSIKPGSEWISVKDRLPENDGHYIVCRTINPYQIVFEARWKEGKWMSVVQLDYITYWMPLPEPPPLPNPFENEDDADA